MAYTAVVLDHQSKQQLIDMVLQFGDVHVGWLMKAHHMTCDMKPADKSVAAEFIGQEVELTVTRYGRYRFESSPDIGICAVEVQCIAPSKNAIKHVTVAHHQDIKPVKSNDITDWRDIDPIVLRGVVQEVA